MKRTSLFAAFGSMVLLVAGCAKDAPSGGQGSGGVGGSKTEAGGNAGGTRATGAGGSLDTGGSMGGASSIGSGGAGGNAGAAGRDAGNAGGAPGSGGGPRAKGGAPGSGGQAGAAGASAGGRSGTGGALATGGVIGADGGAVDSALVGTIPSAGCGKPTTLTSARASIDVGGTQREYILALPKNYDQNHPYKLIFAWHPWTGSAQMVASGGYFGLQKESNNEAIFVAGEGQDYQDAGLGWGNANDVDINFYQAMLARFRSELCIDESRIFSTGFSFGAMFSFTLGCEPDSMLRAIMPMAGNAMTSGGCASGTRQVAVMAFIGTDDTLLDGHRKAVETYAKRDGCSTETTPMQPSWCDGLDQKNLPCSCVSYQGCASGYPVIACEYKAGHQQAPNPGPIWDFVSQF
jgi:polyhydroxybutyrate depolymerase